MTGSGKTMRDKETAIPRTLEPSSSEYSGLLTNVDFFFLLFLGPQAVLTENQEREEEINSQQSHVFTRRPSRPSIRWPGHEKNIENVKSVHY